MAGMKEPSEGIRFKGGSIKIIIEFENGLRIPARIRSRQAKKVFFAKQVIWKRFWLWFKGEKRA